MGTNWYIDSGSDNTVKDVDAVDVKDVDAEGDTVSSHIGLFTIVDSTFVDKSVHFVFYKTKEFQMQRLLSLFSTNTFVVREWGVKRTVEDLYNELLNTPFIEQDYEFS